MLKQLEEAKNNKQLLEIYRDLSDVEKFKAGKVLNVNEEYTILADISADGLYDGFSLIITENIFQINKNTRYLKNLEILFEAKKQNHFRFDVENEDLIQGFFEVAKKQALVVIVEISEVGTIQGLVNRIEDDIVVISALTNDGVLDGETFVKKEDITCITCDNQEANCLKILYSFNIKE
ncbi:MULTISPECIES: hypothetical protein [unclassified Bacillus (in: firmicutes)]|uniref:hypothetical protein n=1 Tax=unclassified Bacillus (in: firmicutes) TaxID=185979 RepID=UPI0008F06B55|nr:MULTISPECIES: hypothetical protein [unclassified Bacillus (in: firmicutes)]SFA99869.1 hypothetical protein SAMN02799634_103478 [Bacillus sp. UNCCL13]SFQ81837.1 hypothetical protein SAMN04488577_2109 [Bacillus sp. cl95]